MVKAGIAFRGVRSSSDAEKKERASRYLMEVLGKGRGLPVKLGQFLTMDDGSQELCDALSTSIPL